MAYGLLKDATKPQYGLWGIRKPACGDAPNGFSISFVHGAQDIHGNQFGCLEYGQQSSRVSIAQSTR